MSKKQTKKEGTKQNIKKEGSRNSLTANHQNEQLRRAREKQVVDALNRQTIHKYLKGIEPNKQTDSLASRVIESSNVLVQQHLKTGNILIPENPSPLPKQQKKQPKLSNEQQKERQIKSRREQIKKKIDYLSHQIRGQYGKPAQDLTVTIKDVLTKQEHQQKIRDIMAQKLELKRRQEQLLEEQEKRKKEEEQKEEELRILEKQKLIEQKRSLIQINLKKRKENHQKFLFLEQERQKKCNEVKNKERLYHKMQQKYQSQVLLPSLEQKKNKLRALRDFHKQYDLQAIHQHQKQYIQRQSEKSKDKQQNSQKKITQYHPPPQSQRLKKIYEEEQFALRQKYQQKRIRNEENQRRRLSYQKQIKSKFKPIVDQSKKQQIIQRYIQEDKKHQKRSIDSRKIGHQYMEIAKKMRRSQTLRNQYKTEEKGNQTNSQNRVKTGQIQLSRAFNRSQEFYENMRRKKMEGILNSEERSSRQKYALLKLETDKIGQKIKMKQELFRVGGGDQSVKQEAAELLLSSIKAKMGIMNVLQHKQQPQ